MTCDLQRDGQAFQASELRPANLNGQRTAEIYRVFWSGRWESNPTPNATKLLNLLVDCCRLASSSVHNRGYFLNRFAVRISDHMAVNLKSRARV